jgi:hypothetical protein
VAGLEPLKDPALIAEAEASRAEARTLEQIEGLPDDIRLLSDILGLVQTRLVNLEERRLEIAKPLHEAKTKVDAHFRELRAPYEAAKEALKARLERIENERRLANREALALASQYSAEGDTVAAQIALDAVASKPTIGAGFRYIWEWELTDLSKVPLEFLALNAATLKLYTQRFKDSEEIPGIPGIRFQKVAKAVARQG